MTVGGPVQRHDPVAESGPAPTAFGEPVVVRPVQGQSVESVLGVGDPAEGQGRHALQPERIGTPVDQPDARAQEARADARLQGDLGGQSGHGIRQSDRRTLPASVPAVPHGLVVAVDHAVADGRIDKTLPRPHTPVPGGGDLDERHQAGPVLIGRSQPNRSGDIDDGVQPERRKRPDTGPLDCSSDTGQRSFPFRDGSVLRVSYRRWAGISRSAGGTAGVRPALLQRIVSPLLTNAVLYVRTRVGVVTCRAGAHVRIEVNDGMRLAGHEKEGETSRPVTTQRAVSIDTSTRWPPRTPRTPELAVRGDGDGLGLLVHRHRPQEQGLPVVKARRSARPGGGGVARPSRGSGPRSPVPPAARSRRR